MKWIKSLGTFISPIFTEKGDDGVRKLSLGRLAFWITFGVAVVLWVAGTGDITASHMQMLYITTTYNLMKKTSWFGSVKTNGSEMEINHEVKPPKV